MKLLTRKAHEQLLASVWEAARQADTDVNPYEAHVHEQRPNPGNPRVGHRAGISLDNGVIYWCSCNRKIVRRPGHPGVWKRF